MPTKREPKVHKWGWLNRTKCGMKTATVRLATVWKDVTCGGCRRHRSMRRKRAEQVPEKRIRVRRITCTGAGGYKVAGGKSLTADEFASGNWSLSLSQPKVRTGGDDGEE